MDNFSCKFYFISCLLFLFSGHSFAEGIRQPSIATCTFNIPQDQQAFMVERCLAAANEGDKEAQYQLGLYYSNSQFVVPNYLEAMEWFKKASAQAHVDAQVQLGYLYLKGQGTPVNYLQAYIIFKIAGINGSDLAMDEADIVAENMSQQELQQANYILGKTFRLYLNSIREEQIQNN